MAFIVEDGTGKSDATSYISVTAFKAYWTDRGTTFTEADAVIQGWLVRASEYIDLHYQFFGYPSDAETQALQWPRGGLRDSKQNEIASNSMPQELLDATSRVGKQAKNTDDLESKVDTGIQSKRIGPMSISYKGSYKADYKTVTHLLRIFTKKRAALQAIA